MTLSLTQSATACGVNGPASFLGVGGMGLLTYAVLPGGAGGTINASTGLYRGPAALPESPANALDTIQVTDGAAATATAQIMVGSALQLLCNIVQTGMGLAAGRVYLWDQKIMQPTDSGIYVAIREWRCKPFANANRLNASGDSEQYVSMQSSCTVDVISRSPSARVRKEEVVLAFNSNYSQAMQEANGFFVGKIPASGGFLNLSDVDGAAIPYRYQIGVNLLYTVAKTAATPYYDTFSDTEVTTDP